MTTFWLCLAGLIGLALGIIGTLAALAHGDEPPPRPRILAVGARGRVVAKGSVERFQDGVWP